MKINRRNLAILLTLFACLVVGWFVAQRGSAPSPRHVALPPSSNEVNLVVIADWGYDKWSSRLQPVARQMRAYLEGYDTRFHAAFLAGDNFYGDLRFGASDRRWQKEFQQPFAADVFAMPFYVALGNHDYDSSNKLAAEFEYVRRDPSRRWKLPSKWYAVDFPPENPVVTVLVLDSNVLRLTSKERKTQLAWLESTLAAARTTPWVIAVAHHPLFSNGRTGDTSHLIADWGPLLKEYGVDFYVCGHDHGLQHLQIDGWPISFVVSGGGGAKLQAMRRADRGPFSRSMHGFLHLQLTLDHAVARFISVDRALLHEFTRQRGGAISIAHAGGRDRSVASTKDDDFEP